MANASTWADEVRGRMRETAPWHYVDVPLDQPRYDAKYSGEKIGCVVDKINEFRLVVREGRHPHTEGRHPHAASAHGRQTPTRRVGAEAAEGRHPRGRQTPTHGRHGMQAPTRRVGADVGFSSLSSEANPMGEAGRTTAKLSDGSSHGVRAARSTRRSTNWREPSALPRKAGGQKIGFAS